MDAINHSECEVLSGSTTGRTSTRVPARRDRCSVRRQGPGLRLKHAKAPPYSACGRDRGKARCTSARLTVRLSPSGRDLSNLHINSQIAGHIAWRPPNPAPCGLTRSAQPRRTGDMKGMDEFTARAFDLVSNRAVREAFDLDREPDRVKCRDGPHPVQALKTPTCGRRNHTHSCWPAGSSRQACRVTLGLRGVGLARQEF